MMKLHNSILTIFLATFFSSTVASENYFGVNFTQIVQDGSYPSRNLMRQNDGSDFFIPKDFPDDIDGPNLTISDPDARLSMVNFVIGSTFYEGEIGSFSSNLSVELRLGVGMHNKSFRKVLDFTCTPGECLGREIKANEPGHPKYPSAEDDHSPVYPFAKYPTIAKYPTPEQKDDSYNLIWDEEKGIWQENKDEEVDADVVVNALQTTIEGENDQEVRNLNLDIKAFYGIYYKYSIGITERIFPYVVLGYSKAEQEYNYTVVLNSEEIHKEKGHVSEHDVSYGFGVRFGQTESSSFNIEYMNYLGSKNMPYDGISLAFRAGF
jgi:hypothetical protein